ncbi:MAG: alpha/beta fold hydrolase [Thermomicrobiales bacterium]
MSGRFVEVNGTRLWVEVAGADDAPSVVFVHGFSLDTRMWDGQFEAFAGRYRVARYDLRGFGRSAVPEAGVVYQHGEDLRALLDALGIERAALIGLSRGGEVALDFALQWPERVSALALVDSALPGFDTPELWAMTGPIWKAGRESGAAAARDLWAACSLFEVANERPDCHEALTRIVADYSGWHWTNHDPCVWTEPNCVAQLGRIAAPTLVVAGERDIPDMLRIADTLALRIAGARKVVLPGLGHLPNMEDAEAFNDVVLEFLGSHAA